MGILFSDKCQKANVLLIQTINYTFNNIFLLSTSFYIHFTFTHLGIPQKALTNLSATNFQ